MRPFSVWYADGSVLDGSSREDYLAMPAEGVQVIAEWRTPASHQRRWHLVDDRYLWTGEDEYDPFDWGVKRGSLLPDDAYFAIWNDAAYGPRRAA